jgi:hypothetical protein
MTIGLMEHCASADLKTLARIYTLIYRAFKKCTA